MEKWLANESSRINLSQKLATNPEEDSFYVSTAAFAIIIAVNNARITATAGCAAAGYQYMGTIACPVSVGTQRDALAASGERARVC